MPTARILLCLLIAAAAVAPANAATPVAAGCVAPSFHYDAAAADAACSALLEDQALSANDRARILTLRGRARKVQGHLDAAIGDFETALAFNPDDSDILLKRAWAADDQRDFDLAGRLAEKVLAADPNNAEAYEISASIAFRVGDYPAAKRFYDKAIALQPKSVSARFNRMILYKVAGAYRDALREADALLALDNPELDTGFGTLEKKRATFRTMTRLERALMWESLGQTAQAEQAFTDWVAVEPGAFSYGYRAAFYERHERYDEALADLDKALADDPNFWLLYHTQGRAYSYTHRDADAVRSENRAIALNPRAGVSYWLRAMSERRLGEADAALRDALEAVAVDRGVRDLKIRTLAQRGYLQLEPNDGKNPLPALADAVQACMLDKECW